MKKNKNKNQLQLLNCSNALDLSKLKERAKIKMASQSSSSSKDKFFENLISVEELAVIFGLAPQTIRNWIALGKIPHVKIGRRNLFLIGSVQEWLNQKEKPQWR